MHKIFFGIIGGGLIAYGIAQRNKSSEMQARGLGEDDVAKSEGVVSITVGIILLLGILL